MSGHDLDKLIHLYTNNPQMQDKLKERLSKSGRSDAQVDKTMKNFNEYMKLVQRESEGEKLTEEELRRKEKLGNDKDVRECAAILVSYQRADAAAKLTADNEQRRIGNTEVSYASRQNDFANVPQKVSPSDGASVYFGSYATPVVKTGIDPQAEFNMKAVGKLPEHMPKPVQMALAVAEPSGLGI